MFKAKAIIIFTSILLILATMRSSYHLHSVASWGAEKVNWAESCILRRRLQISDGWDYGCL